MAYVITVISYDIGNPMPTGQLKRAVMAVEYEEIAAALFNWRPGDKLDHRESTIMAVIDGRAFNPMYDGTRVEIDHWGAAQAVNWMVENGYDPVTQDFIPSFNEYHS